MKKQVKCHCCNKTSVDVNGRPKKSPICWPCMAYGGSIQGKCLLYDNDPDHGGKVQKWVIDGTELVRDVIEARNEKQACKIFMAKYPAVYEIKKSRTLEKFNKSKRG